MKKFLTEKIFALNISRRKTVSFSSKPREVYTLHSEAKMISAERMVAMAFLEPLSRIF